MSDDLVLAAVTLWMTLGAVACGAAEAATGIGGLGATVWFGGMVAVVVATLVHAAWEIGASVLRR